MSMFAGSGSVPDNSNQSTRAEMVYDDASASLADAGELDSGWMDLSLADKYQLNFKGDTGGLIFEILSKPSDTGPVTTVTLTYEAVFFLANFPVRERFIRIIIRNSTGSAITNVSVQVKATFGSSDKLTVSPLSVPPVNFSSAGLVKSVVIGQDTNEDFHNAAVNELGALVVADFGTEVARGVYSAYQTKLMIGRNEDIDTASTPEDMWHGGGDYTGFNATGNENIAVSSSSANDAGALVSSGSAVGGSSTTLVDSGATFITDGVAVGDAVLIDNQGFHGFVCEVTSETTLTVRRWDDGDSTIHVVSLGDLYRVATATSTGAAVLEVNELLNEEFIEQTSAYVIMNGTTTVTVTGDYMRCSKARVLKCGSNGFNVGEITATQSVTTANVFFIMPLIGSTTIGVTTIPAGKVGVLKRIQASIIRTNGNPGSATILLSTREAGSGAWNGIRPMEVSTDAGFSEVDIGGEIVYPGTDIKFMVSEVSDNNTRAEGEIEYYLIAESSS